MIDQINRTIARLASEMHGSDKPGTTRKADRSVPRAKSRKQLVKRMRGSK